MLLRRVALGVLLAAPLLNGQSQGQEHPGADKSAEAITIPLDEVWAYDMPGTRDIEEIELEKYFTQGLNRFRSEDETRSQMISSIRATLARMSPDKKALPGEAYRSSPGGSALRAIGRSVSDKSPLRNLIVDGGQTTILFFSHPCNYHVHLQSVVRNGSVVHITYRFVPQKSPVPAVHFALIPLGKLPVGDYEVEIAQAPMEQQYIDEGFEPVSDELAMRLVCQSFSFRIWKRLAVDPGLAEGATEIPLGDIWALAIPGTKDLGAEMQRNPKIAAVLAEIRQALDFKHLPSKNETAPPAFVVMGTGPEALPLLHDVLVKKQPSLEAVLMGSDLSVVFYSYQSSPKVKLQRVEVKNNKVTIRYRFIPYEARESVAQVALIPLQGLVPGEVKVEIVQSPRKQPNGEGHRIFDVHQVLSGRRFVCGSFSFLVGNKTRYRRPKAPPPAAPPPPVGR